MEDKYVIAKKAWERPETGHIKFDPLLYRAFAELVGPLLDRIKNQEEYIKEFTNNLIGDLEK